MAVAKVLASAMRWPPFLFSVLVLYWSFSIACLTYSIRWLDFKNKRNDVLGWACGMKRIFRFKVLKVGSRELYTGRCMYLCNHRSWADFMVDQYATHGRGVFLSRWAVMAAFPFFMFANYAIKTVLMFKRGTIADKEKFNKWIEKSLEASPQSAIAVYPEGHRSTHGASLPLKRGMLHFAFSRKMPIQVVIGANKEAILSEKHCTARFGQTVVVGYSEVINPAEFADFEQFMGKVQQTWDTEWNAVFGAELAGLPEMTTPEPQFDYTRNVYLRVLVLGPVHIAAAAIAAYLTFLFWRAAFALLGPLQTPVLVGLALYVAAAFCVYSRPANALTLHESMAAQQKQGSTGVAVASTSLANGAHAAQKLE